MAGIVTAYKKILTKSGQYMCVLTVEDLYGIIECVMYSNVFEKYKNQIENDAIVKLSGRLKITDGREPSVVIDKFSQIKEKSVTEKVEEKKCYLVLKVDSLDNYEDLYDIVQGYPGSVYVYLIKEGKKYKLEYNGVTIEVNIFGL